MVFWVNNDFFNLNFIKWKPLKILQKFQSRQLILALVYINFLHVTFYMQHEGRGEAVKVDEKAVKWTKICLSMVQLQFSFVAGREVFLSRIFKVKR